MSKLKVSEIKKDIDQRLVNIYKKYNIRNNYLTEISSDDFANTSNRPMVYHEYNTVGDAHPLPLTHYQFVEQLISPKMGITLIKDQLSDIIIEQENIVKFGKLKHET